MLQELFKKGITTAKGLSVLKEILEEDEQTESRSGNTRLLLLAQEIKATWQNHGNRKIFELAVKNSYLLLPLLSSEGAINLHYLLKAAKVDPLLWAKSYRKMLARDIWDGRTRQRAEIFRLLADSNQGFSPEELENEWEIKKQFPWLWIDIAARSYWVGVRKEVSIRLKKGTDSVTEELLIRISLWYRLRGEGLLADIQEWRPFLSNAAMKRIMLSIETRRKLQTKKTYALS